MIRKKKIVRKVMDKITNKVTNKAIHEVMEKYNESAISAYAGETAFFMMLSFLPFMLFFFSLLNITPMSEQDFFMWTYAIIPESFQNSMTGFVSEVYSGSNTTRIVTVITALWLSSKAFVSLQRGLNSMYNTQDHRNYIILRIKSVLYSAVLAVLLLFMLGLLVFGKAIRDILFKDVSLLQDIIALRAIICIPVLFLFFWLLYIFVPSRKQKKRRQLPGAAFATLGWLGFSFFFSIYANNYNNYASFYGAMTTIALIMVWLYGCMYVVFIGGFINSYLEERSMQ